MPILRGISITVVVVGQLENKQNRFSPLCKSTERGFVSIVKRLIDAGEDINEADSRNRSPIQVLITLYIVSQNEKKTRAHRRGGE